MIYFLIPAYNEKANVANLARELGGLELNEDCMFVFSDDGSTDGTPEIITEHFSGTSFVMLGDGINRGPGAAFDAGFNWITKNSKEESDLVVTLEADCTSDLRILPIMLYLSRAGFDLVLASVYAQGGGFDKTSAARKIISIIANFAYRIVFDVKVLTLSSFYRVYKVSLIRKIQQQYSSKILKEAGYVSMIEILLKAIRIGASMIEVPMTLHSSKRAGKSKMKVFKTSIKYIKFLSRVLLKGL